MFHKWVESSWRQGFAAIIHEKFMSFITFVDKSSWCNELFAEAVNNALKLAARSRIATDLFVNLRKI